MGRHREGLQLLGADQLGFCFLEAATGNQPQSIPLVRKRLSGSKRLRRLWPRWSEVLLIIKPETVVGWHRAGFRRYWRWRSRPRGGRLRMVVRSSDSTDTLEPIRGPSFPRTDCGTWRSSLPRADKVSAVNGEKLRICNSSIICLHSGVILTNSFRPLV